MQLSPLAEQVLADHRAQPDHVFYDDDALGSLFESQELDRLDAAYLELEKAGLMERAGVVVSIYGRPKALFRLAAAAKQNAQAARNS